MTRSRSSPARAYFHTAAAIALLLLVPAGAARAQGKKYALLVGINRYDHREALPPLLYAENDVIALAEVLRSNGYGTEVLTETAGRKDKDLMPTRANVQKKLQLQRRKAKTGDLLIVALSGHGMYFEEESYFCPQDARISLDDKGLETLLSLKALYRDLGASPAAKILLVDACRNDPKNSKGLTDKTTPPPPRNTVALFSCSIGELSWEVDKYEQGLFFHHVIEGLKGKAQQNADGDITWDRLQEHVRTEVSRDAPRLVSGEGSGRAHQEPTRVGEERGAPVVVVHLAAIPAPKPANIFSFARWSPDEVWYPGRFEKEEDGKVLVHWHDDTSQWLEKSLTGRFELEVGDRVTANWKNKGGYYRGTIGHIDNGKIRVDYDDGDSETTTVQALRMKLDNPALRRVGMRVTAYWKPDGYWYPAAITEIKEGNCQVRWDDGTVKWLQADQVSVYPITVNDRVQGDWKKQGHYYLGTVTARTGKDIHIKYDDGDEEDTTIDNVRMQLHVKLPVK